tara:strand:+ start:1682 stop:1879 length:198 start_codon:yes stop_codon:yes gene_type:complete
MTTAKYLKFWSIRETENSFVFTNAMNLHIELDKLTGEFIAGNVCDNDEMRKEFKLMMSIANKLIK